MIQLPNALTAWGTPAFETILKQELAQLNSGQLPLQQGMTSSSQVTDRPIQAMVLGASEQPTRIEVKVGVFYTGVIAGCNCADDPSPVDEQNEYCVLQLVIDRATADTTVTLLTD
jgi:hypothetical protein